MCTEGKSSRRTALKVAIGGVASLSLSGWTFATPPAIETRDNGFSVVVSFPTGKWVLEFDAQLHTRITSMGEVISPASASEVLVLEDGSLVSDFDFVSVERQDQEFVIVGLSKTGVEKQVILTSSVRQPGFVFLRVVYRNVSDKPISVAGWRNAYHHLQNEGDGFWSFSGASHEDRRDWLQPVNSGFNQRNYMGMNASDYGGGVPVVDVWHRNVGLAVGHVEPVPRLVSLPLTADDSGAFVSVESQTALELDVGQRIQTWDCFICVHEGDYFRVLDGYRAAMKERGVSAVDAPEASYEPIWCAWGYERNFVPEQILGTLPKVKELGFSCAVLDDGWQTAEGDWQVNAAKFSNSDEDFKAFAAKIKASGLSPRLWIAPLAVDPGADLLHDHVDMLLLDPNGAVHDVTFWNSFTLCPAYQPTVDYFSDLMAKVIGEWGFEGVKLDGQHLNGVAPCYNPAHKHSRPEESCEKLQHFWKTLYDRIMSINPKAVVEICPCGTSFAFHNIGAMNQTPASDPLSSWQVRQKGKTFKALMGRSAPYSGDHVELSDGGNDFASTVGVGGVISTKFTWPSDTNHPSTGPLPPGGYVLTSEKEALWRKWLTIYQQWMLPKGRYLGELYDIGFDKPETHVIEKDGRLHFAFYADTWDGEVKLRGLEGFVYEVQDVQTGERLGEVSAKNNRLNVRFKRSLLIVATPKAGA